MKAISVEIPIRATWPSRDELASRNRITNQLTAAGLGKCTGAGGGGGKMDFSYRIENEEMARATINSVMNENMPGVFFTVRVTPLPQSA